jgi:hypothetical protein
MNKRGRPKQGRIKAAYVLERVVLTLYAYGRARKRGEKHSAAISEAVKYIRHTAPAMRISKTEAKRIVAIWRPQRSASCLVVEKPHLEQSITPVLRGGRWANGRILYRAFVAQRPVYQRANAAAADMRPQAADLPL